jgi:hypothetical protein
MSHVCEAVWPGVRIRFRHLTWKEFRQAKAMAGPIEARNLWVYETALLLGPKIDEVPAGVVAWVGFTLVDQNPFNGDVKSIQQFQILSRQWFENSFLEKAKALVAGTFRYTFEEIDQWDQEVFFKRLAAAEFLVGKTMTTVAPQEKQATGRDAIDQALEQRQLNRRAKHDFLKRQVEARRGGR